MTFTMKSTTILEKPEVQAALERGGGNPKESDG